MLNLVNFHPDWNVLVLSIDYFILFKAKTFSILLMIYTINGYVRGSPNGKICKSASGLARNMEKNLEKNIFEISIIIVDC